ncbi:MAG: hypothetical protein GY708_28690 [Actinomycetia bacterium]|nr:hypothetical protein [Actinomycetes bacterium]MCP4961585.1 hypothetical protein [Actinomycetes bacterium]
MGRPIEPVQAREAVWGIVGWALAKTHLNTGAPDDDSNPYDTREWDECR